MKKTPLQPEIRLISMALVFFGCALLTSYFFIPAYSNTGKVIYVSDSQREMLIDQGEVTSVLINLNSATKEELMVIDGIGEALAQAIIDYRESSGGFSSVDELLNVKGIGESRYGNLKPYVYVE